MAIHFLRVGASASSLSDVKAPNTFSYGLQDVSTPDAGRVLDGNATMYKCRFTQKRKISLGWTNPTGAETSAIMQAFNSEYVFVSYLDALSNEYETREFYTGDKSAALKIVTVNGVTYSSLSFDLIER